MMFDPSERKELKIEDLGFRILEGKGIEGRNLTPHRQGVRSITTHPGFRVFTLTPKP
jgi:hypothetical protein